MPERKGCGLPTCKEKEADSTELINSVWLLPIRLSGSFGPANLQKRVRALPGIFEEDFSGHSFPRKKKLKIGCKIRNRIRQLKNENPLWQDQAWKVGCDKIEEIFKESLVSMCSSLSRRNNRNRHFVHIVFVLNFGAPRPPPLPTSKVMDFLLKLY